MKTTLSILDLTSKKIIKGQAMYRVYFNGSYYDMLTKKEYKQLLEDDYFMKLKRNERFVIQVIDNWIFETKV